MKLIPLLLLVGMFAVSGWGENENLESTKLRAEELPFRIGDAIAVRLEGHTADHTFVVLDIKGKWVKGKPLGGGENNDRSNVLSLLGDRWYNSDQFTWVGTPRQLEQPKSK